MSQVRPPGPAVTEAVDEDDGTGHCRVAVCGVCVAGSAEGGAEGAGVVSCSATGSSNPASPTHEHGEASRAQQAEDITVDACLTLC